MNLASGLLEGKIALHRTTTGEAFTSKNGTLEVSDYSSLKLERQRHCFSHQPCSDPFLSGTGNIEITNSVTMNGVSMSGSGKTIVKTSATGTVGPIGVTMEERTLVNKGTLTQETKAEYLQMARGRFWKMSEPTTRTSNTKNTTSPTPKSGWNLE